MTRHPAVLVAPVITLLAVLALLIAARFYDRLPFHPPPCGFRSITGVPCFGCGATRAAKALAGGDVIKALRYHPALVLGCVLALAWTMLGIRRYQRGLDISPAAQQNQKLVRAAWITAGILLANWIYLFFFLPR
jgi:Protein of unknown function (DUF2752)